MDEIMTITVTAAGPQGVGKTRFLNAIHNLIFTSPEFAHAQNEVVIHHEPFRGLEVLTATLHPQAKRLPPK